MHLNSGQTWPSYLLAMSFLRNAHPATGNDPNFISDRVAGQSIADKNQAFNQRAADVVGKFERGRAGSAFAPIHGDKIGGDARFDHGFAQGQKLVPFAHAQFETDGFAAGQFAQFGDKGHHFQGCAKGGVSRGRDDIAA